MKDEIRPSTAAPLPCGEFAVGRCQCGSYRALRDASITVRRCTRNLWFSPQPVGEIAVRLSDMPRQRVTTHRFVNRQVANGNSVVARR
jgi:hypothetical protein